VLVDFPCVFDQPLQQRRWRVAEILTEFVENELGVRPEGRRPVFRWKHDLVVGLLGNQIQQITAPQQRQQRRVQQNFQDTLFGSRLLVG